MTQTPTNLFSIITKDQAEQIRQAGYLIIPIEEVTRTLDDLESALTRDYIPLETYAVPDEEVRAMRRTGLTLTIPENDCDTVTYTAPSGKTLIVSWENRYSPDTISLLKRMMSE